MQYYYQSHIRNLEDQALLERRRIDAQLHEEKVLKGKESLAETRRSQGMNLRQSRREEDEETAAYLERSRLQAQLSATRVKAEGSMNRSRLQAAFQLRRQNKKAFEEVNNLTMQHEFLRRKALAQEETAHQSFLTSKRQVEDRLKEEDRLFGYQRQLQLRALEMQRYERQRYYWPY